MKRVSIIIPTLGRDSLYPLIKKLLEQKTDFSFEIVLIPQIKLKEDLLRDKRIKIHYEPLGKGFAYYRNIGVKKSGGDILVFIDDDEIPMNNLWLKNITKPIIEKKEKIVTSGYKIKLGQGYLTDCISLLGFPGGGAIGFEVMWPLKEEKYTYHICTGNLSIQRKTLNSVGNFNDKLISGNEDVELGDKLIGKKFKINYLSEATVYHVARKGYFKFIKWNFLRGKSAAEYLTVKKSDGKIGNRFSSSMRIILKTIKTKYFLGVLFMIINQYLIQLSGYIWRKIKK